MGDRLGELLKQALLSAVVVGQTERARDIEREFALAIGGSDFGGEATQGEALFDMAHSGPEAFRNRLHAHTLVDKACEGFHLVHGVHGHALDILSK